MSTTEIAPGAIVLEEIIPDDQEIDFSGWFCISTDPFPCPATGCDFVALHATAAHMIVVFPEKDDPRLLDLAAIMFSKKRNPKVMEYEVSLGPCISYDQWEARGRPVHAILRDQ
jgi:hypothetical protein